MRRPATLFPIFAIAVGLACMPLGFWQLSRLGQRRAANAIVAARLDSAVTTRDRLPADTGAARFRRVRVAGTYDYAHEIVISNRSRDGSPGVNLLTPLRLAGSDSAVLVNRGWVYSPDAMLVDLPRWREPAEAEVTALVNTYHDPGIGQALVPAQARTVRFIDPATIDSLVPYPVMSYYLVAIDSATQAAAPVRLAAPSLDEGSHLSYAIQWFSFAAIGFAGAAFVGGSARRGRTHLAPPAPPLPS